MPVPQNKFIPEHAKELIPGIHFWENAKNEFAVLRVHYLSDPGKRDPSWRDKNLRKMGPAQFNLHYEIDFSAMGGQRVFPELDYLWEHIEFDPKSFTNGIPPNWVRVAAIDWGIRHPAAMTAWAIDTRGEPWAYKEFRQSNCLISDLADELMGWPEFDRFEFAVFDPSMKKTDQSTREFGNTSIFNLFVNRMMEKGKSVPVHFGTRDDTAAIDRFRELFCDAPEKPSRIHISTECPMLKQELFKLQYAELTEKVLQTRNPSEQVVQKGNDLWDTAKYFLLSNAPIAINPDPKIKELEEMTDPFRRSFWEQEREPVEDHSMFLIEW